jgi:hypothetical protein
MRIRRPLAALVTALTLFGGGATLAGCGDPTNGTTGGPADTASNTSGNNPSDRSQGNLPDNSNREPSSTDTGDGSGNG